jgi:hypothetical protein
VYCLNTGHKADNLLQAFQCFVHKNTRMTRAICDILQCHAWNTEHSSIYKNIYNFTSDIYQRVSQNMCTVSHINIFNMQQTTLVREKEAKGQPQTQYKNGRFNV